MLTKRHWITNGYLETMETNKNTLSKSDEIRTLPISSDDVFKYEKRLLAYSQKPNLVNLYQ